jgi:hypothetical protein
LLLITNKKVGNKVSIQSFLLKKFKPQLSHELQQHSFKTMQQLASADVSALIFVFWVVTHHVVLHQAIHALQEHAASIFRAEVYMVFNFQFSGNDILVLTKSEV